ncbi:hypothetical protein GQ43DRAFT_431171 [Delitschia confertaspora ATCC 74209]|uniref:Uncharacterized protein n=1 Tax=Delitschia confertaspora ATCC 74209 TaxID=1513339 RepID=A0A9P4JMT4_9PLEO|nr:hypothetical protein GQ43DRAFT_431171 [Delitschia confertaspora ATCC 74209]
MYQGKLDEVSDIADPQQKYEYAVSCYKLYLLCDRFDMPELKNVAMDQYRKGLNEAGLVPDAGEINEIYRKSPIASPFRRLMTKIAARQIMDPDSETDVESYRGCLEENPDFAVGLLKAIKEGTGGILFDDPTSGNGCEFHNHEGRPNCHIKGKGKVKQGPKTPLRRVPVPQSSNFDPFVNTAPRHHHHHLSPALQTLPSRQARLHRDGVGPLRRSKTTPAVPTMLALTETTMAIHPMSPRDQMDKFRLITPAEKRLSSPPLAEEKQELHPQTALDEHPQNSEEGPSRLPLLRSQSTREPRDKSGLDHAADPRSPRPLRLSSYDSTGLFEWTKLGTGRWGIVGRMSHPDWKGPTIESSKTAAAAVGVDNTPEHIRSIAESLDDYSLSSITPTQPKNEGRATSLATVKTEGLGIAPTTLGSPLFAETRGSSDTLFESSPWTPSPKPLQTASRPNDAPHSTPTSTPSKPSNAARKTSNPNNLPKYKIALTNSLLSHATRSPGLGEGSWMKDA